MSKIMSEEDMNIHIDECNCAYNRIIGTLEEHLCENLRSEINITHHPKNE